MRCGHERHTPFLKHMFKMNGHKAPRNQDGEHHDLRGIATQPGPDNITQRRRWCDAPDCIWIERRAKYHNPIAGGIPVGCGEANVADASGASLSEVLNDLCASIDAHAPSVTSLVFEGRRVVVAVCRAACPDHT